LAWQVEAFRGKEILLADQSLGRMRHREIVARLQLATSSIESNAQVGFHHHSVRLGRYPGHCCDCILYGLVLYRPRLGATHAPPAPITLTGMIHRMANKMLEA
jgi:hypothetical protein